MANDLLWRNLKDLPGFRGLLRAVEARFYQDVKLPAPVLDLGCGDGHFASVAFDHPLDAGVDPWARPLKEAARLRRSAYRLIAQAEGGHLPFPTGHFASAVSNSVLEHIPDLDPVLVEVARVLQPGAPFVFCVPNSRYFSFLSIASGFDQIGLRGVGEAYREWFRRMSRVSHADEPPVWQARLERTGFQLERHWDYFSSGAMRALEWGHYFGSPALMAKVLTGRWVMWPSEINLALTQRLMKPYYDEPLPEQGAFTFYCARRL